MAHLCKNGNKPPGFIKCGEFNYLKKYLVLKKDSAPWNYMGSSLYIDIKHKK